MSFENVVYSDDKKAVEEHEKTWGGYNDLPPGWTEITAEEFAQSGFFTWSVTKLEFRQVVFPATKLHKAEAASLRLFYMNSGDHYAMTADYWGKKVRYFKFATCFHNWVEISAAEAGKPAWNCYHYCKCTKCDARTEYDSSG